MQGLICPAQCKTEPLKALDSRQKEPQYLRLQYPRVQKKKKKKWVGDSGKVECTGKQKLVRQNSWQQAKHTRFDSDLLQN